MKNKMLSIRISEGELELIKLAYEREKKLPLSLVPSSLSAYIVSTTVKTILSNSDVTPYEYQEILKKIKEKNK